MTGPTARLDALLHELTPPTAGECHVWHLPVVAGRWDAFDDTLDEQERVRRDRFVRPDDRGRYQTAHVGVRLLLGGYLKAPPRQLRFDRDCRHCPSTDHGKPALRDAETTLDFSLSHSGDLVTIAVAAVPVGVDVQVIEPATEIASITARSLAPAEREWLAGQPADRVRPAFFGYWARKEALLKATGHGLAVGMSRITLSPPTEPARLVKWADEPPLPAPAWLHDLAVGAGYAGSVAVLADAPVRVTEADLPAPG